MGISKRDREGLGGNRVHFFSPCRLIYDSLPSPPPPSRSRLQQRAGAPHHASRASRKTRTRLCCRISWRKDGPCSPVSLSVFSAGCVCVRITRARSSPVCVCRTSGGGSEQPRHVQTISFRHSDVVQLSRALIRVANMLTRL